ncbi:hypothetical protein SAMN05421810_103204 [Amycolatopsis arida]|uniref:Uncharacterized protein n=1 Tax=Amycolatopsis arida TaxID=587909 RepID=A0A1I5SNC9_9PSEU|nr:hypothetical protein [Amycolatopsis arida]TDX96416.1 hypothetical protein CLV69_103554 [Amycolatopsis arida]SFP72151.1 hypothetical protein SAMN05421810_103204 [Amycolatopsis arida]
MTSRQDRPAGAGPTGVREREPALDVLRGFALFGILVANVGRSCTRATRTRRRSSTGWTR